MGQGLLVDLEVEMWAGFCPVSCSFLWNALEGAGMQLLALGMAPRGPYEATLGTFEIEMVVSIRQPCALSAPLGLEEKGFGK